MKQQLILKNDIEQIVFLEGFIETLAGEVGIDPSQAMSLNLALEEAVTNVILYAYSEGTVGEVCIDAVWDAGQLTFTVTDSGKPFDPTGKEDADITLSAEERPIGGLGIFLVKQLMDEIKYERVDGKNILTMKKNLQSGAE